ncbi:hypothetical protein H0H93_004350 [Arthromyces matolae]|nr:hypothetical protein H0H93_004350 [Arthromyces matolae]
MVIKEPSDVEDKHPEEEPEPEIVLILKGETTCQEVDDAAAEDDASELFTVDIASAADSTSQSFISRPLPPVDLESLPISQPAEPAPCTPDTLIALPSLTAVELPTSSNGSKDMSQLLDISTQTTKVIIENQVTTMEGDTEDTEAQEEEAIDAADVDPTTSGNTQSMETESDSDKANVDVQVDSETDGIEHNDGQEKARHTKNHKWFVVQNGKAVKAAHTSRPSASHRPVPLPAIWEPASFNRFAVFEKPPVPAPASKKARKASKSLQAAATVIHKVEEKNENLKASTPPVDDCSPSALVDVSMTEVVIEEVTREGDTEDTKAQEVEVTEAADVGSTTSGNGESMEIEGDSDIANVDDQVDSVTEGTEDDDDRDKVRRTKNDKWFVVQNGKTIKAAHTSRPSASHQSVPLPAIWEPNSFNRFAAFEKPPAPAPASKKAKKASKSLQAPAMVTRKVEEDIEDLKASDALIDNCSPSETSSSELVDVSMPLMPASISATVKVEELPPVTADENEGWSTVTKRKVLKATKTTSSVPETSTSEVEARSAKPTMKAKSWLEMLKPQTQPALKWDFSESPWESQVSKTATSAFSYARAAVIAPGPLASAITSSTPSDTTIPASSPWKDVEPAPSSTSGEAAVVELATEDDWLSPEDKAKGHKAAAASIPSPRTTTSPTSEPANASSSITVERNDIEPALSSLKSSGETALASSGMPQTALGKADTMRKERRDRAAEVARFDNVMERLKSQLGGKTENMTPEIDIRGSETMCSPAAGPSNHVTPSPSLNHDTT